MPEVTINGPAGRIEARYHHEARANAPIALILHPHPQFGGTMNNQVVYNLYYAFAERGFSVLRFNFRGVEGSAGKHDGAYLTRSAWFTGTIHGHDMPGVEELAAGYADITVAYSDQPDGARLTYTTGDPDLIDALHSWFDRQVMDHGDDAKAG